MISKYFYLKDCLLIFIQYFFIFEIIVLLNKFFFNGVIMNIVFFIIDDINLNIVIDYCQEMNVIYEIVVECEKEIVFMYQVYDFVYGDECYNMINCLL